MDLIASEWSWRVTDAKRFPKIAAFALHTWDFKCALEWACHETAHRRTRPGDISAGATVHVVCTGRGRASPWALGLEGPGHRRRSKPRRRATGFL